MPEATTEERPKTDNSRLDIALTIQTGERAARVKVTRAGSDVSYEQLGSMSVKDLLSCRISILGMDARFHEKETLLRGANEPRYNFYWQAFGSTAGTEYEPTKSAVEALEKAYQFVICAATGEI